MSGDGHFLACQALIPGLQFLVPNNVYLRHILNPALGVTDMPDEEWIKTLEDGRKVKFIYQELPKDGAFITAQIGGNEVVYSVVLDNVKNQLSHEDVESHFKGELAKK
jgi:hypothetical protein